MSDDDPLQCSVSELKTNTNVNLFAPDIETLLLPSSFIIILHTIVIFRVYLLVFIEGELYRVGSVGCITAFFLLRYQ